MAKWMEWTEEQEAGWAEWVSTRPSVIQEMCALLQPNRLYLLKQSGHRVTILSYSEDRTVTVAVTGEYNAIAFDRQVFGIKPEDLEECDLPAPDERVGTAITDPQDVDAYIKATRPAVAAARREQEASGGKLQ